MKFLKLFYVLFGLTSPSFLAAQGVLLHVDATKGDDTYSGSTELPLKSVGEALRRAQEGSIIVLASGTYRESIRIDKNNISILAGGDSVIWDGTEEVELSRTTDPKIFSATLLDSHVPVGTHIEQVFNSSKTQLLWEARWPNVAPEKIWVANRGLSEGWAQVSAGTGVIDNSTARIAFNGVSPFRSDASSDTVNVIFNAFSQFRTFAKVAEQRTAPKGFTLTLPLDSDCNSASSSAEISPCHQKGNALWWNDDYFYLFGHRDLLDAEGEWFYAPSSRRLEVLLSQETARVHIKVRPYAITIDGAENIKIEGMKFFATALRSQNKGPVRAQNISISGNHFQYPSWDRMLRDNLKHVEDFKPAHPTTEGIRLTGDGIVFENNLVEKGGTYGLLIDGARNIVRNNILRDIDWFGNLEHAPIIMINSAGHPGIPVEGKILSNTVHNFGNVGIRFFGPQIEVAYNNVYNGGLLSLDTALIYTARAHSRGSRIHHNFVHDGTGIGIRLDGFSVTGMKIDHNVVWNVRRGMKISGFENAVLNNTIDVDNPHYSLLVEWGEEQKGSDRAELQNRTTLIQNNLAYRIHYRDRGPAAGGRTVFGELYNSGVANNPSRRLQQCKK